MTSFTRSGWWYSHNFNQRLIIDGGNYYVLAHGDAFRVSSARQVSMTGYTGRKRHRFQRARIDVAAMPVQQHQRPDRAVVG